MRDSQMKLFYAVFVAAVIVVVGAVFFHTYEKWGWLDSFYFAVTTISTVGFGDLHPTVPETKIFVMGYVIFGVAIMLYAFNALGQYWVENRQQSLHKRIGSFARLGHEHLKKIPKPPTAR